MAAPMYEPKEKIRKVGRPRLTEFERKLKVRARNARTKASMVYIGDNINRWKIIKDHLGLESDVQVARRLIDAFFDTLETTESSEDGKALPGISGLQQQLENNVHTLESRKPIVKIEVDDTSNYGDNSNVVTKRPCVAKVSDASTYVATPLIEGDSDKDECCDADKSSNDSIECIKCLVTKEQAKIPVDSSVHLCYKELLLNLAHLKPPNKCKETGCDGLVTLKETFIGSALYFNWICDANHNNGTWCSQPVLRKGLHAGDLLTSAAILCSGNDFEKIHQMTEFMKLPMVNADSFMKIQDTYLLPAVEKHWQEHQADCIQTIEDACDEVVIAVDELMDSSGQDSQYCTYTTIMDSTKEILSVETVNKKETRLSWAQMREENLLETLQFLEDKNIEVKEVITDIRPSIATTLKNDYPDIKHSYDIWYAAMNMSKKIVNASQQYKCGPLKQWCNYIVKQFYLICEAASSHEEFVNLWFAILHHTVNEHVWILGQCRHEPLTEPPEIPWLQVGTPAHDALREIIADRNFLKNVPYFLNARSTADIQDFRNLITLYAEKRFSYTTPVYRARNLLAALYHNERLNKDSQSPTKTVNTRSNKKSVRGCKVKNKCGYIDSLLKRVFSLSAVD